MAAHPDAMDDSPPLAQGEALLPLLEADPSRKRRRMRVKGPAAPPVKRRRLTVKGPATAMYPVQPRPPAFVLPLFNFIWNGYDNASFEDLPHRRQYRLIYNKFDNWFFTQIQLGRKIANPTARRSYGAWLARILAVSVSSRRM